MQPHSWHDPVATNRNCDELERSGKQEVHFKTKKAPESTSKHLDFSDFVFQLLYLIRGGSKMNQNESKWTKGYESQYYRLVSFSIAARRFNAISWYFIIEPPTSREDWLFRFSNSSRCCSAAAAVAEACCASCRKEALRNLKISWDAQVTCIHI